MPSVTFIRHDGTEREIDARDGISLMENARGAGIEGIEGDCGGNLSCASCHVYVDEEFLDRLQPVEPMEDELLDIVASERLPNSRLSCQIVLDDALDGIRVTIPENQY